MSRRAPRQERRGLSPQEQAMLFGQLRKALMVLVLESVLGALVAVALVVANLLELHTSPTAAYLFWSGVGFLSGPAIAAAVTAAWFVGKAFR